jgi:hypothetical protein
VLTGVESARAVSGVARAGMTSRLRDVRNSIFEVWKVSCASAGDFRGRYN